MNGFPIYDNNTITIAAGSIINLSTLSTSIILNQATQGITMTSVPTTTIRGFTGTDDGILRVNGYVALYGSSTQLQIYDANGIIKGSLSYSYTDDDIHLNATQLLDLTGIQGVALTSQTGQRIRFNTVGGGNLDADIEGSITLTAGYSTSIGNINLYTASTSIVLDQASQSITLTANNDININASTLINGSIKVASTFYDNNASSGTSGQVLTAGTGGQVIWNIPAVSNYPYIWQYYKGIDQTLNSNVASAGTFITWNGVIYEEPGYPSPLTNLSTTYSAPLNGWYQITFVGVLCGAVTGSQGDIPQGGTWPSFAAGLISQFTYGIRLNALIVPGWQGYLNGYVVSQKCGDQTQLVVIKYLSTNDTILVDNETPVGAPNGNFAALASTTLTITYLRP